MKLNLFNNNIRYGVRQHNQNEGAVMGKPPYFTDLREDISFKGNPFSKKTIEISVETVDKLAKKINGLTGKADGKHDFFTDALQKSNFAQKDGKYVFQQNGFLKDLGNTLKYPFVDLPRDIAISVLHLFKKEPKADSILGKRIKAFEFEKSKNVVFDAVEQFSKLGGEDKNIDDFAKLTAKNIAKIDKNYLQRDERTLTRIVTALVSAVFSANDFYNISMLEANDKKGAKKAQKHRFKQEISRMALSAGLTFVTMGALDKYIKNNIILSSVSIALSTLISEVGSRLWHKTPLLPLTPKEAEKRYNEKYKKDNAQTAVQDVSAQQQDIQTANGDVQKTNNNDEIQKIDNNNETKLKPQNKKKHPIAKTLGIAVAASSLAYLFTHGKYTKELADELLEPHKAIKKFLTKSTKEIQIKDLEDKIAVLKKNSDVDELFSQYSSMLQEMKDKSQSTFKVDKDRFLFSGLYNGFSKIFKTCYNILSLPGAGIKALADKINKVPPKPSKEIANEEALGKLYELTKNINEKSSSKEIEKALSKITKNVRVFETGVETGELANLSRTLVTLISSYFFVNDYRNGVLIESKGKNIERANEEKNERIAHKLSNFVINGTLMNLFNSTFKEPINSSLLAAMLVSGSTEITNEFLVRKSICQPVKKMQSKDEIIEYEKQQLNKKGFMGWWTRTFMKLTGKKPLSEKNKTKKNN